MVMQTHIDVQRVTYPGNRPSKIRSQTGKTEKKIKEILSSCKPISNVRLNECHTFIFQSWNRDSHFNQDRYII